MSLKDRIAARITAEGPISVADYMAECLFHPEYGYYTTKEPFGTDGDFVTAPEISQMFGELVGLALAHAWIAQGSPAPFTLAELGPGRGTLMADILRGTAGVPGFGGAAEVTLVEASPRLRDIQKQTLDGHTVRFLDDATDLPEQALFVVANEFFDALPVRQFIRAGTLWRERRIGLQDGSLVFGLGTAGPQPALGNKAVGCKDGDLVEVCPFYAPVAGALGDRISNCGGAGLIIDYGDRCSLGDTLQAVKDHAYADVLESPGSADLTAHVDFGNLARAAGCGHTRLTTQGVFLERLGITARAQALAAGLSGPRLDNHIAAHRRLTHPDEMGNLFKVLGLFPAGKAPPPGLDV